MEDKEMEELRKLDDIRPTSYTLRQIKNREDHELKKRENVRMRIIESLEYYNNEYPNSTRNREWKEPKINFKKSVKEGEHIDDFLDKCTEQELYDLRKILEYTKRESTRILAISEKFKAADAYIKKGIPGIKYLEKLEAIQEKENAILREKEKYERLIKKEREAFEAKKTKIEIIEPIESNEEDSEGLEPYFCSMCARNHVKGQIYHDHLQYKTQVKTT